jgi:hypothetical protein
MLALGSRRFLLFWPMASLDKGGAQGSAQSIQFRPGWIWVGRLVVGRRVHHHKIGAEVAGPVHVKKSDPELNGRPGPHLRDGVVLAPRPVAHVAGVSRP